MIKRNDSWRFRDIEDRSKNLRFKILFNQIRWKHVEGLVFQKWVLNAWYKLEDLDWNGKDKDLEKVFVSGLKKLLQAGLFWHWGCNRTIARGDLKSMMEQMHRSACKLPTVQTTCFSEYEPQPFFSSIGISLKKSLGTWQRKRAATKICVTLPPVAGRNGFDKSRRLKVRSFRLENLGKHVCCKLEACHEEVHYTTCTYW